MQQFYALLKKEFYGYFHSYFALVVVFIYLLVSSGIAFYASYLDMHDTGLYALFNMQIYIQAALIPALTMKLWSEEYKSGTAEFLLTQPLAYRKPVIAKICAATMFGIFMSLLLLPFIHDSAELITLDWGNIVFAYIGLWLVIFVFCAVGSLISALNKNMISVYLLSLLSTTFLAFIPSTHFRAAYTDFLLAEIGVGDWLYFFTIGGITIFLNILVLQLRASAQKYKMPRFIAFSAMLFSGFAALCFVVYTLFEQKYDATAQEIYTPQQISRDIVKNLKKPLRIDVYISKDYVKHNIEYSRYYQQVMRFLKKYEKFSNKKIKVNAVTVEPFSKLEDIVLKSGLYYEENIYGSKDYFGAIIRNEDGEGTAIKHFFAARSQYLEKDIDTAILKLDRADVMKSIGVYLDPFQYLNDFQGFLLNLENDYNLLNFTDDVYEISPKLDLLLLVNPKKLSSEFKSAIDRYITNGGKVIILFDFLTDNQSSDVNIEHFSLLDLISSWGINFSGKIVDIAEPNIEYAPSGLPISIYKAVDFNIEDSNRSVIPLITDNHNMVAALITGKFPPLHSSDTAAEQSADAQVAVFGDVDLIIDDNWIAEQSPDKNPYDTVFKSSNIELLRNLIDRMTDNEIYFTLPVRYAQHNTFSISEKIFNRIYEQNAPDYSRLSAELIDARSDIEAGVVQNPDIITQMLQSGAAGQRISELEIETENILRKIGKEYKNDIHLLFISQVLVVPSLVTLLMFIGMFVIRRKHRKVIREFMNE